MTAEQILQIPITSPRENKPCSARNHMGPRAMIPPFHIFIGLWSPGVDSSGQGLQMQIAYLEL